MAKRKTTKKAASTNSAVSSASGERPTSKAGKSAKADPQSIATALKAAIELIKAAGGVERALEFVDNVQGLIEVCGSAEIARQTLQACRGVLEIESTGESDVSLRNA